MRHQLEKQKHSHEVLVKVELNRKNKLRKEGAWMPYFPKKKDEGCWLVIGHPKSGELLALRRIRFQHQITKSTLNFEMSEQIEGLLLYLIWDCYLGLDQQQAVQMK